MNLAELRSLTYSLLGVSQSDPAFPPGTVDAFLNAANHKLSAERDWPWLEASTTFATLAGVGVYAPPLDWLVTLDRGLTIAGSRPFSHYARAELDDRWYGLERGQPYEYAVSLDRLVLRPVPDGVYTVTHVYVRQEPDLTGDTHRPLSPSKFHAAIADGAVILCLRSSREDPRSVAARASYAEWVDKMEKAVDRRTRGVGRVRARPDP